MWNIWSIILHNPTAAACAQPRSEIMQIFFSAADLTHLVAWQKSACSVSAAEQWDAATGLVLSSSCQLRSQRAAARQCYADISLAEFADGVNDVQKLFANTAWMGFKKERRSNAPLWLVFPAALCEFTPILTVRFKTFPKTTSIYVTLF